MAFLLTSSSRSLTSSSSLGSPSIKQQVVRSIFYGIQFSTSCTHPVPRIIFTTEVSPKPHRLDIIMLLAMYYNGGVIFAIFTGGTVGFFLSAVSAFPPLQPTPSLQRALTIYLLRVLSFFFFCRGIRRVTVAVKKGVDRPAVAASAVVKRPPLPSVHCFPNSSFSLPFFITSLPGPPFYFCPFPYSSPPRSGPPSRCPRPQHPRSQFTLAFLFLPFRIITNPHLPILLKRRAAVCLCPIFFRRRLHPRFTRCLSRVFHDPTSNFGA